VELLEKEWAALSSAPWAFALFSVVMFGIAFAALRWRYEDIVESFRERLETLRQRLEAKDAQLDEYRERLHLLPASGSGFSRLTHLELKQKALQFVEGLRAWLATWSAEDSRLRHQEWTVMVSAKSEEEKRKLWNQFTGSSSQSYLQLNSQYDAKFKVDSILLRDEILSRLPQGSRDEITYSIYEHPTNPIGMGMVAEDLERMAKLLC
jgi:hypothetical protein